MDLSVPKDNMSFGATVFPVVSIHRVTKGQEGIPLVSENTSGCCRDTTHQFCCYCFLGCKTSGWSPVDFLECKRIKSDEGKAFRLYYLQRTMPNPALALSEYILPLTSLRVLHRQQDGTFSFSASLRHLEHSRGARFMPGNF